MDKEFNWLDLLGQDELMRAASITDATLRRMDELTENGKMFVIQKISKTVELERSEPNGF